VALYYITGTPGAGKSTTLAELKRRGYTAYETDDMAAFYNTDTGNKIPHPATAAERTPEWRKHHEWRIPAEKVSALRAQSEGITAFLCGVVGNDAEFWHEFDRVFCLYLSSEETKRRLVDRPGEAHGKNPHELASTLEWASYARQQYTDLGAIIVDASMPVNQVADEIVRLTHDRS